MWAGEGVPEQNSPGNSTPLQCWAGMELLPWKSCWWINGIPTLNIQPGVLEQLKPRWSHSRVISSPERGDDCFHFTLGLISGHFSDLLTCFYIFIFLPPWTTVPQFIRIYYMCCLPHILNNIFFVLSLSRSAFLNIDELFIALEVSCAPDFTIPRVFSSSCGSTSLCCTRLVFLCILSLHCSH